MSCIAGQTTCKTHGMNLVTLCVTLFGPERKDRSEVMHERLFREQSNRERAEFYSWVGGQAGMLVSQNWDPHNFCTKHSPSYQGESCRLGPASTAVEYTPLKVNYSSSDSRTVLSIYCALVCVACAVVCEGSTTEMVFVSLSPPRTIIKGPLKTNYVSTKIEKQRLKTQQSNWRHRTCRRALGKKKIVDCRTERC